MQTITARLTEQELATIGRAMEQEGFTSLEQYIAFATLKRAEELTAHP
jgi:uncharacterized protein (DUF1778 family)